MLIEAFGATDVGRARTNNEDYFLVDPGKGLFVVCDGMGGHAAGEVASRTAAETVWELLAGQRPAIEQAERAVREAVETASQRVFELGRSRPDRHGMGTTCTVLLVAEGGKMVMGHVGDSRCYLLREGSLDQLSNDHTYEHDAVRHGLMTPEEARCSPFAGRITRAIGVRDTVTVDTLVLDAVPGDTFLLCSDGLHQYTEDRAEALAQRLTGSEVSDVARSLVGFANEQGGADNVTAVVLRFREDVAQAHEMARKHQVVASLATLRHVFLFQDLTASERMRVLECFRPVNVEAGGTIVREHELGESLFVVVEGRVQVFRGEDEVASLGRGSHFGEMALLSRRPRSASVRAQTDVRLLELPRTEFLALMGREAVIGAKFLWKLAQSLSLRLDDAASVGSAAGRRTLELSTLSPFRR